MSSLVKLEEELLEAYRQVGEVVLPLDRIDGLGRFEEIQDKLLDLPQAPWQTMHYFSEGTYTRVAFMPAGAIYTGYPHNHTTTNIVVQGAISVVVVDSAGKAESRGVLKAADIFVSGPGTKKLGFTHEDTIFVNVFGLEGIPAEMCGIDHLDVIEEYIFDRSELCRD
jgi:hypothetical protein